MPAVDDEGLDSTQTWGRTYWGGAMFCLLADVQIRRRTNSKRGLVDVLRGVLSASGGIRSEWPIARALKAGDEAVGVPVLEELYAQMKSTPISPDLAALWRRLGVETKPGDAPFDDLAPEAPIRRAISARPTDATSRCGVGS
jgi:predicted metalloprotease with PDZ domain